MSHFVYFISDGEYIKIGISSDIQSRLASLQTANARDLILCHSILLNGRDEAQYFEGVLHQEFAEYRAMGEWFKITWERLEPAVKSLMDARKDLHQRITNARLQMRFNELVKADIEGSYEPMKHWPIGNSFKIKDGILGTHSLRGDGAMKTYAPAKEWELVKKGEG